MPTWKLTLEYDGTRYHGWQSQKNADRTVQGVLGRAARELLGEDATVGGAGRTDAGVHALAQIAHVKARKELSPVEIQHGLNDRLPFDVNVMSVEPAPPDFHARHDAASRRYLYRISRRRTAFEKRLVWWVKDSLDASTMREAARLFVGRHDFSAFCENAAGLDSTEVVVVASEVTEAGQEIHYRIEASHFLWKMVRRLVGTLIEVGRGNLSVDEARRLLDERLPGSTAVWTAPPSGLFLEEVRYGKTAPALVSRRDRVAAPAPRVRPIGPSAPAARVSGGSSGQKRAGKIPHRPLGPTGPRHGPAGPSAPRGPRKRG
ncbi:MAG: tRNA pseudouridine(38-40) synthase TruA [Acidobacteria bacterium]|nr:tRNA pseudouridine(38-40) synthase TruA [Acidobacteriota bacterium]